MTTPRRSVALAGVLAGLAITAAACRSTSEDVCVSAQDGLDQLAIVGRRPQVNTRSAEWKAALRHFGRMAEAARGRGHPRLADWTAEALRQYAAADAAVDPAARSEALVAGEKALQRVAVDCRLAGLPLEFQ